MEIVQKHELQDIYRLEAGILLVVNKHKTIVHVSEKFKKKKLTGISKGYISEEAVTTWKNVVIPAGTMFLLDYAVEPLTKSDKFSIELKTSGGTIHGNPAKHRAIYKQIEGVLSSYEK